VSFVDGKLQAIPLYRDTVLILCFNYFRGSTKLYYLNFVRALRWRGHGQVFNFLELGFNFNEISTCVVSCEHKKQRLMPLVEEEVKRRENMIL